MKTIPHICSSIYLFEKTMKLFIKYTIAVFSEPLFESDAKI